MALGFRRGCAPIACAAMSLLVTPALLAGTAPPAVITHDWVDRYNGPGDENDGGFDIAVAADGSIYAAGIQYIETVSSGSAVFVPHFATVKYAPDGTRLWVREYPESTGLDSGYAQALTIDHDGNIVVTGPVNSNDFAIVKYDPAGDQLWAQVFPSSGTALAGPVRVLVNAENQIHVAGSDGEVARILKLSPAGSLIWERTYAQSWARDMALDDSGNVYITGSTANPGGGFSDVLVAKYDDAGVFQWARTFTDPFVGSIDTGISIAVTGAGNVAVGGTVRGNTVPGPDWGLWLYDPAGNLLWDEFVNGPANNDDELHAIAIDSQDNIIAGGYVLLGGGNYALAVAKVSAAGSPLWTTTYDGGPGALAFEWANDLAVDSQDRILVAGRGFLYEYVTMQLSPDGMKQWQATYPGPVTGSEANALALGADGAVYVTGQSFGPGSIGQDLTTLRYTPPTSEPIPADLNGDGSVNGLDLAILLVTWGPCPLGDGSPCPADFDGSGVVNGIDLAVLLNAWG